MQLGSETAKRSQLTIAENGELQTGELGDSS